MASPSSELAISHDGDVLLAVHINQVRRPAAPDSDLRGDLFAGLTWLRAAASLSMLRSRRTGFLDFNSKVHCRMEIIINNAIRTN